MFAYMLSLAFCHLDMKFESLFLALEAEVRQYTFYRIQDAQL